jgi:hypothetical protein
MPFADSQLWLLIALLCGIGVVTYLLNRGGRKVGWYFLAALTFIIIGSYVVWSAFDFATGGDLNP